MVRRTSVLRYYRFCSASRPSFMGHNTFAPPAQCARSQGATVPALDRRARRRNHPGQWATNLDLRSTTMAAVELKPVPTTNDLVAVARQLGPDFARRAAEMDETDTFV